ncbi:MAG: DUF3488 domain-containing transglutaminase family protein [Gammaproteobacteria bacterium]|nr:DUF3488 domain-containing transglutaminase family protein [Gammaproteobacteria bacterium]
MVSEAISTIGRGATGRAVHPTLAWLVVALTTAAAPHFARTPVWVPVVYLALAAWRLWSPAAPPGREAARTWPALFLILFLGACILAGVYASYGTLTGRDAGVSLLILLAALKLIELRHERDFYIAIFIGLFLLLTNFFFIQSILSAVFMGGAAVIFVAALVGLNDERGILGSARKLLLALAMLAQALPLMLVLFVLFPRVAGPLWGMPKDARSGSTGLDDEMAPGAISDLTLSDEVAFRVEFAGAIPPRSELYWRGPVLWSTDGVKWIQDRPRSAEPQFSVQGQAVEYTVTLEPTERNWLFSLELPSAPPRQGWFTHDMQIRVRSPVQNRVRYTLSSYPDHDLFVSDREELQRALQLPPGKHAHAAGLSASWRGTGLDDAQVIQHALEYFNQEEFYYTLSPPPLLDDTVDQFLFETRRGFCEHFAAAFVVLMRAAGIPARVVTGYQGGAINPVGQYLIVRQRDAHAWAEVWLGEEGWVRIDPTAAVAPSRILEGIESALPESIFNVPLGLQDNLFARTLWERFRFTWDAFNNRWNQWVLGYDRNRQSLFLHRLGLGDIDTPGLVFGLTITGLLILLAVAAWLFKSGVRRSDEAKRLYDRFCRRLARCGMARQPSEGPEDFARRAGNRLPQQAEAIRAVTTLYIAARYAGRKEAMPALRQAVGFFRSPSNIQNWRQAGTTNSGRISLGRDL